LLAWPDQSPDRMDARVAVPPCRRDGLGIAEISLDRVDLPDPAHRLQMTRQLRPANCNADAIAAFCQCAHNMAAEKTRAAEDSDQRFKPVLQRHARRNT